MKNTIITIAIILGLGMATFAQDSYSGASGRNGLLGWGASFFDNEGGLFSNANNYTEYYEEVEEYNSNQWGNQGQFGLFGMGEGVYNRGLRGGALSLPTLHGGDGDQNADAPLGSGIALLAGLGAAYLVAKRRREE